MKVKCLSNKKTSNYTQDSEYEFLDIGKEYTVYGMIIINCEVWYYICERKHNRFPLPRPSNLFEIIDNRLSRYWIYGIVEGFKKYPVWMFPEWINETYFEDSLTDGEEREVAIFNFYKELMDLEFPDSSITETAQIGDNEWLICPTCIDAWQSSNTEDALVKCPKCQKIFNNPRYKNE